METSTEKRTVLFLLQRVPRTRYYCELYIIPLRGEEKLLSGSARTFLELVREDEESISE